jgi:dihydroflavonol-4-reductase
MRAFVTGATGFIGGYLARQLRDRGDEVVALVRAPARATDLQATGCELIEGDLDDMEAIAKGMAGADAVFHVAGMYKIGIPPSERPAMYRANVEGTERVLDAAVDAGVARIVYVSTVNVFGNTRGATFTERDIGPRTEFLSEYDRTKYLAHMAAEDRIARGAPVMIAMPGGVYGPGDTSQASEAVFRVATGPVRMLAFPETGFTFAHVEDVAAGILLVHDKGRPGESYILSGELSTVGDLIRRVALLAGKKPPRLTIPGWAVRMGIPFGPLIGRMLGQGPNLRELIDAADGVTYWASHDKATAELGFNPRPLDAGLPETVQSRLARAR